MVIIVLVLWWVGLIWENEYGIWEQNYVHCCKEVKCQMGCTPGIWEQVHNNNHFQRMLVALWLTLDSLILVDGDHFPRGHEVYLLFNYDIVNYLLNTTEGKTEGLILLFL